MYKTNNVPLKNVFEDDFWIMPATPKYIDKGIPYITSKNIRKGEIDFTNVNYISEKDYYTISKNRPIKNNDILISMIGTLGETAVVNNNVKFYGQNMFCIRLDKNKIDQRYFLNYFSSDKVKRNILGKRNKSTQSYLKANHIEELLIPLPDLEIQKSISSKLDKVRDILNKKEKQLKLLDSLIKSRFIELFGDGSYPQIPLIQLIVEGAGLSYGIIVPGDNVEDGVPMVRPSDFNNGELCLDNVYRVAPEIEVKYTRTRLIGNEILVQVIGQPGQIMLSDSRCKGMNVTRNLAVVRPDCNRINRIYLKTYMQSQEAQAFMLGETKQSTLKQLPLSRLKELEIPVPPMELQEEFAAFVEQTDKSKVALQKSIDELQQLFDSLMQEYFG
ncbi:MAG: restriction endonuclease subunit S [Bacilli bacterium]|nr:restriction endonuclease subunit S [Bacilli bacterium]